MITDLFSPAAAAWYFGMSKSMTATWGLTSISLSYQLIVFLFKSFPFIIFLIKILLGIALSCFIHCSYIVFIQILFSILKSLFDTFSYRYLFLVIFDENVKELLFCHSNLMFFHLPKHFFNSFIDVCH